MSDNNGFRPAQQRKRDAQGRFIPVPAKPKPKPKAKAKKPLAPPKEAPVLVSKRINEYGDGSKVVRTDSEEPSGRRVRRTDKWDKDGNKSSAFESYWPSAYLPANGQKQGFVAKLLNSFRRTK